MIDNTFARFLLVGIANTFVGYTTIMVGYYYLEWPATPANALGYSTGAIFSYFLNRRFTFNSEKPHATAIPMFAGTLLISYSMNLLALHACLLAIPMVFAQLIATATYTCTFFLISKKFVFTDHLSATMDSPTKFPK